VLEPRRSRLGVHKPTSVAAALLAELSFVRWNGSAKDIKRIEKRFLGQISALDAADELGWIDVGKLKAGK